MQTFEDIKKYKEQKQFDKCCEDIRKRILEVVSTNGGHLSSSLGCVELIVAMHYVFDVKKDPFIFDVSHQAYAHKLLTNRWEEFSSLREYNGICGFTKPSESEYDYFVSGHSSTSISVAVGAAKAINIKRENRIPVVLIGDGSMSAGMVYEAMNELGDRKYPMVIIINDNEMSISKPIGAISKYLSKHMAGKFYQKMKSATEKIIEGHQSFRYLAKKFDESLKLITPGMLFEELGLEYIGPVDGHNVAELIEVFETAKNIQKPVVIHAQTIKGKGYKIAEGTHEHWHGVSPFNLDTGKLIKKSGSKSATDIFSDTLIELAKKDHRVVGVTAAMPSGTGLTKLIETYPHRFWDVAIAEQHAVTSCASMAKEGLKAFCVIYSTFLQRGFDQIIHDVAISKLPVKFAIDRAGIVGEDGETHQGTFDVNYLRLIPNLVIFAPRDEESLKDSVFFANDLDLPCAFRYPRGNFCEHKYIKSDSFVLGKSQLLKNGKKVLLVGFGNGASRALKCSEILEEKGIEVGVLDLRFVAPIDEEKIILLSNEYKQWVVLSDNVIDGGVGSAIMEVLSKNSISINIESFEFEKKFLGHGKTSLIEEELEISMLKIVERIERKYFSN